MRLYYGSQKVFNEIKVGFNSNDEIAHICVTGVVQPNATQYSYFTINKQTDSGWYCHGSRRLCASSGSMIQQSG